MEWAPIISALASLVSAMAVLVAALKNNIDIRSLHREVNSRLTQLVDVTSREGHARGVQEERDRTDAGKKDKP